MVINMSIQRGIIRRYSIYDILLLSSQSSIEVKKWVVEECKIEHGK